MTVDSPSSGHSERAVGGTARLRTVLQRYSPELAESPAAELVSGGFSGAQVWKVSSARGAFAARNWPAATDAQRICDLHGLLRQVAAAGLPVAVPLQTAAGDTLLHQDDQLWQVEPWLPGVADFHVRPTPQRLRAAMQVVAAFHATATQFARLTSVNRWRMRPEQTPATVTDRLDFLRRLTGEAPRLKRALHADTHSEFGSLAAAVWRGWEQFGPQIAAELHAAAAWRVPVSPVLRDIWHDHLLFSDDAVTGLIDPAACRTDTVAADLSRLLGSLIGDEPRWSEALAAYQEQRPLTAAELQLVPVLDRSGVLLSGLAWLRRRYLAGEGDTVAVRQRLRAIVQRIGRLGGG